MLDRLVLACILTSLDVQYTALVTYTRVVVIRIIVQRRASQVAESTRSSSSRGRGANRESSAKQQIADRTDQGEKSREITKIVSGKDK